MNHSALMRVFEAGKDLRGYSHGVIRLERTAPEPLGQSFTVVEGHHDDYFFSGQLLNLINAAYVGVIQLRGGPGLLEQTGP
jgi:hypothetical protein